MWVLTSHYGLFSSGHLESMMGSLKLLHLLHVHLLELLDLWSWTFLVDSLDVLMEGMELIGRGKGMDLFLELFAVGRVLHLHLVLPALMLESFGVLLKTLNFL